MTQSRRPAPRTAPKRKYISIGILAGQKIPFPPDRNADAAEIGAWLESTIANGRRHRPKISPGHVFDEVEEGNCDPLAAALEEHGRILWDAMRRDGLAKALSPGGAITVASKVVLEVVWLLEQTAVLLRSRALASRRKTSRPKNLLRAANEYDQIKMILTLPPELGGYGTNYRVNELALSVAASLNEGITVERLAAFIGDRANRRSRSKPPERRRTRKPRTS